MQNCTNKIARLGVKLVRQWRIVLHHEKTSVSRSYKDKEGLKANYRHVHFKYFSECAKQFERIPEYDE